MPKHSTGVLLSYAVAAAVLSIYGVEVCPFIEGLGYGRVLPVFIGGFAMAFAARWLLIGKADGAPDRVMSVELLCWAISGLVVTAIDTLAFGFPVGSGAKVMVGTLAIAVPAATYQGLLVEYDVVLEAQRRTRRLSPAGPELRLSTRLYTFVVASQVLLAGVLVLLVAKDFQYVAMTLQQGREPEFLLVAIEIGGAFALLLVGTFLVAHRYGRNLDLILRVQLNALDAVAAGRLDEIVPVVANDEIGQIGDRTNDMIAGLRERERIKGVFGKLVSPAVAEAILEGEGGSDLGGREVEAVVLFTDLRNFTALSERTDPQGVVGFLNEYFTMIVAAVHEQQGVVDKFIGDAAMAVFGLEGGPAAEDAADRAVRAALAMRSGLVPLNARLAKRGLPEVDNGIGMHLGHMVAGNIGSKDRLEYTVIGDAVNTASRLEGLCKVTGNPLLVSSAIYERLSTELRNDLVSLGEHQVKGKTQSIAVYGVVQDLVGTVA